MSDLGYKVLGATVLLGASAVGGYLVQKGLEDYSLRHGQSIEQLEKADLTYIAPIATAVTIAGFAARKRNSRNQ